MSGSIELSSPRLSRILVAIDGSEASDYALNISIKIGEHFSSCVDLIHVETISVGVGAPVVFDPILGTSSMVTPTPLIMREIDKTAKKDLKPENILFERRTQVLSSNLSCQATTVKSDDAAGEILKTALNGNYNLIALGSRGLGGLKSFLLGSVSSRIAREAKCSVLVMKKKIENPPKILLAYDTSKESKTALDLAATLGKKFGGRLDPVSVVSIQVGTEGFVIPDFQKWEGEAKESVRTVESTLRNLGVKSDGKVIEFRDVARALVDESEAGGYDIIVVGSRGHGRLRSLLLGSVASGVANSAKTNVLIVR